MVRQSEILRLRMVAFLDSALVRFMRVAWREIPRRRRNGDGLSPSCTGRAYRDRGSREPSQVTVGTSHIVETGMVRQKTRRYKLSEIRPRRWWRGGLCRVLWRAQHLPGKARQRISRGNLERHKREDADAEGSSRCGR